MITAVNDFLDDLRGGKMSEAPLVTVEQGQLQGRVANTPSGKAYYSFQGIPYATPPLGSLRFKAPQPIEPWEGIRDATSEGNVSAQIDLVFSKQYVGDENCLFLNVYTPNIDGSFLPVMVFIHGGALKYGSGNTEFYGPDFLVEKDVVLVTVNYRLGALGFLSLNTPEVPGNAGLKDLVIALKWVKDNIENFGGNPGNITVFGESAGGASTCLLTASPMSKGMFNKAIVQSGTALLNLFYQKTPVENAINLAKSLGCESESVEEVLDFLTATPTKDIVEAQEKLTPEELVNPFMIVVEREFQGVDAFLSEPFADILSSGRVAHIPIMIGTTTLEFAMERKSDDLQAFIPEEFNMEKDSEESLAVAAQIKQVYFKGDTGAENSYEYYELLSDSLINITTHRYVQYLVQSTNVPIFYYKFDYVGELNVSKKFVMYSLGLERAMHMDDLGYLFRNDLQKDQVPTDQDLKMRERMVRLWTNFAKTGNPTPEENHYLSVTWQPVSKDHLNYLSLGKELSLATDPDKDRMDLWDELYLKHFKIWEHPKSNRDSPVTPTQKTESQVIFTSQETGDFTESQVIFTSQQTEELTESQVIFTSQKTEDYVHESITGNDALVDDNDAPKIDDVETIENAPEIVSEVPKTDAEQISNDAEPENVVDTISNDVPELGTAVQKISNDLQEISNAVQKTTTEIPEITSDVQKLVSNYLDNVTHFNGNGVEKKRHSNEIKVSNGAPKDVIRANDPPEDDLPKNIGVNKFVNFFESLGGKK